MRSFGALYTGNVSVISPDNLVHTVIGKAKREVNISAGTRLTLSAIPDAGYTVLDWYINGTAQNNQANNLTHTMLAEDTTIEVMFTIKQNMLTYGTTVLSGGGTIACSGGIPSGTVVKPGANAQFTAHPANGCHFVEWRYTASNTSPSVLLTEARLRGLQ
ncbi:MAG: hypothetical protein FWH55_10900 [Oscillospiraceae bacterium]|nr:hypothetical protein [Oscillospiraceae bacterium]